MPSRFDLCFTPLQRVYVSKWPQLASLRPGSSSITKPVDGKSIFCIIIEVTSIYLVKRSSSFVFGSLASPRDWSVPGRPPDHGIKYAHLANSLNHHLTIRRPSLMRSRDTLSSLYIESARTKGNIQRSQHTFICSILAFSWLVTSAARFQLSIGSPVAVCPAPSRDLPGLPPVLLSLTSL